MICAANALQHTVSWLGACGADGQQLRPPGIALTAAAVPCVCHASFRPLLARGLQAAHLCWHLLNGITGTAHRCLLIEPFPESALNEEAGKLLLEDYEGYAKHARLMTSIHAQPLKR